MRGAKILITGPTGQVASPIAQALAADNEVWGIARFTNAAAREDLEKAGIRCETVNLAAGEFGVLPSDFDYVLNLAVAKSGDWDKDLGANAESVGLLMAHCRNAKAFLHCSSAAVYDPPDDEPRSERAALGESSPGRWHAPSTCPPSSRGSTFRTATTGDGRSITWR
jgi:UDP-glucuronate 4-epimerase